MAHIVYQTETEKDKINGKCSNNEVKFQWLCSNQLFKQVPTGHFPHELSTHSSSYTRSVNGVFPFTSLCHTHTHSALFWRFFEGKSFQTLVYPLHLFSVSRVSIVLHFGPHKMNVRKTLHSYKWNNEAWRESIWNYWSIISVLTRVWNIFLFWSIHFEVFGCMKVLSTLFRNPFWGIKYSIAVSWNPRRILMSLDQTK